MGNLEKIMGTIPAKELKEEVALGILPIKLGQLISELLECIDKLKLEEHPNDSK